MLLKKILYTCLFFLLFFSQLCAQKHSNKITGYIYDKNTFEPIEFVNVYISNTTFGSSTDKNGYFIIKSIPPNIHELIISVIGYQTIEEKVIVTKNSIIEKEYFLTPLIYETQSIDVTSTAPEEWLENFDTFKEIFLGKTHRAKHCKIENGEIIEFTEKNEILSASITQPLIIINEILGYKIYCNTLSFRYDKPKRKWNWRIKPRFIDLIECDTLKAKFFEMNRKIAYFGSLYHFLVSLKNREIRENGFNIALTDQSGITSSTRHHGLYLVDFNSIIKPGIIENSNILNFSKFLYVTNNSIVEFLDDINDIEAEYGKIYQSSWMRLKYGQITIDEYGYAMEENAIIVNGYWADLGVADLLPRYYSLELVRN